ncbi:TadE family type IV pilus minor pilin [Nocardioides sp.]|uniref:TadE family type IV pilus minor pilin n=1 Tax=Nocardioides sp. TaxID=35761 RepID=UPI003563435D
MSTSRARRVDERGAVTAELAMVLPMLLAVTAGLIWMLGLATTHVRVVDAARESARAAARGESAEQAVARGLEVAPPGSRITVRQQGDRLVAQVEDEVGGPGGLFGFLPSVTVRAEAVAAAEQGVGPGSGALP